MEDFGVGVGVGVGVACRYVPLVGLAQGYAPVDLAFGDEMAPTEVNVAEEAERAAVGSQSGGS